MAGLTDDFTVEPWQHDILTAMFPEFEFPTSPYTLSSILTLRNGDAEAWNRAIAPMRGR
jgi:hypothetical protein